VSLLTLNLIFARFIDPFHTGSYHLENTSFEIID